jgi:hypothetical protein
MVLVVRYKRLSDIDKSSIRAEMEKAFEAITNSRPELRT